MKIRRKQREKRTHALQWGLLVAFAALCFLAYQGVQGVLHVMDEWTKDLPSLENTDAFNYAQESVVYAGDETTMLAEFQLEKRDPVTVDQISPYVLKGTVDTEDVRFYEHNGVDLAGIARAVVNNLRGGDLEGASTITQQLVRNTVLSQEANDISFERKIREAELAIELEKHYSKEQVLVMYLNTINYGDGCYGIEAAAQNYFQVSAADLTLAQAAALVGIPQSPTYLNPKSNLEACQERRDVVLSRMLSAGHITQEEHDAAKGQPLALNPAPEVPANGIHRYPYFTSHVSKLLQEEGNPYGISHSDLFEGGLTIYTSLDVDLQEKAEAACAAQNARMDAELDAALVAIDPATGQVKAMVGGEDFSASQVNIATGGGGSGRQAGSTFKTFALAAAIKDGISPQTKIDCSGPMTLSDGTRIENFDNADYGIRTIQNATAISSNTGYIRLTERITPNKVTSMAYDLGITWTLPNFLSVTTGSASVTPLEMASAYGTLATGGVKHEPVVITKIVDKNDNVVYEAKDDGERVISEEVSGAVTKVLRTVFETSDGTAYGFGPANGQPVAGKTGTSDNFADHWLVGYAPQLSCATWIGNPAGNIQTNRYLTCNQLWQDFMSRALEGQAIQNFPATKDPDYSNTFNKEQEEKYVDKTNPATAPSVVGKTLSEASLLLNGYNAAYVEEYSDSVAAGIVISQSAQNGQVILVVSKGPKPADPAPAPDPTPAPEPDPEPEPPAPPAA